MSASIFDSLDLIVEVVSNSCCYVKLLVLLQSWSMVTLAEVQQREMALRDSECGQREDTT